MTTLAPRLFNLPQVEKTSDDYYTPSWVFERMGIEFDLDVASPPGGIPWIPTRRFFTQEDDGLAQPWEGRVWMNPPYSKPAPWVDRFIRHGNGVTLLPFMKSAWFEHIWNAADAIVFPGVCLSKFIGGPISVPTFLAASGPSNVEAISRLGRVR